MAFSARKVLPDRRVIGEELQRLGATSDLALLTPVLIRITGPADFDWGPLVALASAEGLAPVAGDGGVLLCGGLLQCRRLAVRLRGESSPLSQELLSLLDRRRPSRLVARGRSLPVGERTLVMGVLNLSPDSFSGDGLDDLSSAVDQAERFLERGADIIDVGGMSTRPGSEPIPEREEARRLGVAIRSLRPLSDGLISADTYRVEAARAALEAGADIINDVSGLRDPDMAGLIAGHGAGVVLMHMQGTPATMQADPRYEDVVGEVYAALTGSVASAEAAGIAQSSIIVDPGIGFGKTLEHNLELLRRLRELASLGKPILVGTSRKGFIGRVTGREVGDRLEGTAATVALAIAGGADVVRVHDVEQMVAVSRMSDAIVRRSDAIPAEAGRAV